MKEWLWNTKNFLQEKCNKTLAYSFIYEIPKICETSLINYKMSIIVEFDFQLGAGFIWTINGLKLIRMGKNSKTKVDLKTIFDKSI